MEYTYYGMFADKEEVEKETFEAIKRITLGI